MSDMMTQEEAMNMSNEQAVQILIPMRNMMCDRYGCPISGAVFALDKAIEVLSAGRPQGEWIRTGRTNIYGGIEVQCSNCNDKVMVQHLEDEWYCRHCGADMGMKGADDEASD